MALIDLGNTPKERPIICTCNVWVPEAINQARKYLAAANRPLRGDALLTLHSPPNVVRNWGQIVYFGHWDHLGSEFLYLDLLLISQADGAF